jgi:RNA polymerase sigma-70 factor (ECF subfamily)
MVDPEQLREQFIAQLTPSLRAKIEHPEQLEQLLSEALSSAQADWAELKVDPLQFVGHLARQIPANSHPEQALEKLHTSELFLAFSCGQGDPQALATFEARYFPVLDSALRRLKLSHTMNEEVKQTLREQLFVASPSSPEGAPMIQSYAGRGQLRNWLRIIAVRTAGKLIDQGKKEVLLTNSILSGISPPTDDLELDYLKRTYRNEFKVAFEQALQLLSTRERNLLGHHYVDRLSIDEISTIYSIHRATAARRLARARQALLKHTRKTLMQQIKVDRAEFDSIIRLIESQLPVTFSDITPED